MKEYAMTSVKPPFNPELMAILNKFVKDFFSLNYNDIKSHETPEDKPDENEYYTSDEHLNYMQKDKTYEDQGLDGWAEVTYGINLVHPGDRIPDDIKNLAFKLDRDLNGYFCTKFTAVNMFYPKNGFMGWHHNANCPGWNVIMSYTPAPHQGYFEFIDPKTQDRVRLLDTDNMMDGWTIKVGYYGSHEELDKQVWHCARSYDNERITLAYVIPDEFKYLWDEMVADLTDA